jgi:hypothetical protein
MSNPIDAAVHAGLGRMIVSWNLAEDCLRGLLAALCSGRTRRDFLRSQIVTLELGTTGLVHALQAFAQDVFRDADASKAVLQAVTYFERLREYRNYYVHGITATVSMPSKGPCGVIATGNAKGRITRNRETISVGQMQVSERADELTTFILGIVNYLFPGKGERSLPEMPPLPDRLSRRRQLLTEQLPRARSSRA